MAFAALFDPLYCPEEHFDLYHEEAEEAPEDWPQHQRPAAAVADDDELPALFAALRGKEKEGAGAAEDGYGGAAGREAAEDGYGGAVGREAAVGWACRAAARLGFSALTAALAAAYLDRCFLGVALRLTGGQPWTARLAAVACVALAAKVEETRVPLLLDLQLCAGGEDAYVFEAKTVRRMELLVLSALGWRMHPVTPFSYLQPLLAHAAARLQHCEGVLLAVMADWRWPRHRPSAWAAAALLATASSGDDDSVLLALINAPEDEVAQCGKIISEATGMCFLSGDVGGGSNNNNKRKHPLSPSGVIGGALSGLSCGSSSSSSFESRAPAAAATVVVSVSSSPERPGKRVRAAPLPTDEESREAWAPFTACLLMAGDGRGRRDREVRFTRS